MRDTAINDGSVKAAIERQGCGAHLGDDVAGVSVRCGSMGRLCQRCQPWLSADTADALPHAEYHRRAASVYRGRGVPACRSKGGPLNAVCMLLPGHDDDHYGSGYDVGGPKPALRWGVS